MNFKEMVPKIPQEIKILALSTLMTLNCNAQDKEKNYKIDTPQYSENQTQKIEQKKNDIFIYMGDNPQNFNKLKIEFIGIEHTLSADTSRNEWVYSDHDLINNFFQELKNTGIDVSKVVLVVEEKAKQEKEINIRKGRSIFITPEMEKMGFTQWVAADNRSDSDSDIEKRRNILNQLPQILSEYVKKEDTGKLDSYGLRILNFTLKKTPEGEDLEKIKNIIQMFIIPNMVYEENLKSVHDNLTKKGYKAIVIAGRNHILTLHNPSLLQFKEIKNKDEMEVMIKKLNDNLASFQAIHFLARQFSDNK